MCSILAITKTKTILIHINIITSSSIIHREDINSYTILLTTIKTTINKIA